MQKPILGNVNGVYKVIDTTSMGPIIDKDGTNLFIKTREKFNIGDSIWVYGMVNRIENTSDFDIKMYFHTLNTHYQIKFPKVHLREVSNDIRNNIRNYVLNGGENYNKVTPLLFLGLKTHESKQIYNMAIRMNVVHLFVISGFHISLFFLIVNKSLTLLKVKENISMWIALLPVIIYLFLLGFPISATRAVLLVFCSVVNKTLLKSRFKSLSILSFVMAIMFIIKPRSIYSLSFIFTYIATYVVIFTNGIKFKTKNRKWAAIAMFAFLSNIIIVIYQNHYFSIFGLIYGTVLSPIFVFMYSITLFLFPIKNLMEYIDMGFIYLLKFFSSTNIVVDIPKFSINWVFLSYGIIIGSIIILVTWNLYTEKKDFLSTKKSIGR